MDVAFAAIKEPWWAAVPMGILLAWGASAGWKAYFADRRRWLLLAINVTSLAGALIVIAPVLYAMTFTPLDEINLALVMSQELLMAWAATLAITTFIPLVQIAAVMMYASSAAPDPAQDATPTVQWRKRNGLRRLAMTAPRRPELDQLRTGQCVVVRRGRVPARQSLGCRASRSPRWGNLFINEKPFGLGGLLNWGRRLICSVI